MPTYHFACDKCGFEIEIFCFMSEYDERLSAIINSHAASCDGEIRQIYYPTFIYVDNFDTQVVNGVPCETKAKFKEELDKAGLKNPKVHSDISDINGTVHDIALSGLSKEEKGERIDGIVRGESEKNTRKRAGELAKRALKRT